MIIRHDRSDRESLVDPTWLLTAAHVACHIPTDRHFSVEIAEKRYAIARVIIHPDCLRRVTNIIDEADAYWLKFRFDDPPGGTFLEGVSGGGDSGGPALIQQDSAFLLAGVSSWQHQGGKPPGLYGCVEHYTRVSCFTDWIYSICRTLSGQSS